MEDTTQTLADILADYINEGGATANELRAIGIAMQILSGEWNEDTRYE